MTAADLRAALGPTPFEFHPSADSTMSRAREWVRRDPSLPAGAVVVADFQSEGRSRYGKPPWLAPPGTAVLMTLVYPDLPQPAACWPAAALAVADAVARLGVSPTLKWPNDVLLAGRKLAGCLVEHSPPVGTVRGVTLVGIGVNVDCDFTGTDLADRATSLHDHLSGPVNRPTLVADIADRFARWLDAADRFAEWTRRLDTLGRAVTVETGQGTLAGVAECVTPDGSLVLRLADGSTRTLHEGYVSHVRPA